MNQLDDYFEAYDKAHALAGETPDWETQRRKVRRALARPAFALAGRVLLILVATLCGIMAHPMFYLIAGSSLFFLPGYIKGARDQARSIAALSSEADLAKLLEKERIKEIGDPLLKGIYWAGVALFLFLFAGLLAWQENDFRASLFVGGFAVVLCAYHILFKLPRACRGMGRLDQEDEVEELEPEEEADEN